MKYSITRILAGNLVKLNGMTAAIDNVDIIQKDGWGLIVRFTLWNGGDIILDLFISSVNDDGLVTVYKYSENYSCELFTEDLVFSYGNGNKNLKKSKP